LIHAGNNEEEKRLK